MAVSILQACQFPSAVLQAINRQRCSDRRVLRKAKQRTPMEPDAFY